MNRGRRIRPPTEIFPVALLKNHDCILSAISIFFVSLTDKDATTIRTPFFQNKLPPISFADYVQRINGYMTIEPLALLVTMIYAKRYTRGNARLNSNSIHKFFIAALTISMKCLSDAFYTNKYVARVGGVTSKELSELELYLVNVLGWNIQVDQTELQQIWTYTLDTLR